MLYITVVFDELWDEQKEEFIAAKQQTLQLEHSLVSISKWEEKWCKPFLSTDVKTNEETMDYIRCMTITKNIDPDIYNHLTDENISTINAYIEAPMTATWITEEKKSGATQIITSEVIYYWMTAHAIPFDCEKWHLNRLITLIRVCNAKNAPPKKMNKQEIMNRNAEINKQRRAKLNSKG